MTNLVKIMKNKDISMRTKIIVKAISFPMVYSSKSCILTEQEKKKDAFELLIWKQKKHHVLQEEPVSLASDKYCSLKVMISTQKLNRACDVSG